MNLQGERPRYGKDPQDYIPSFPTDERGKWIARNEDGGPMQGTFGTFQTGGGNSPFFHREQGTAAVAGRWSDWSVYGPWTQWLENDKPIHTSWEDGTSPLGSPAQHGAGTYADGTAWNRLWHARDTGVTRQVTNGSRQEDSGWITTQLDTPWVQLQGSNGVKTVITTVGVPASSSVLYYNGGNVGLADLGIWGTNDDLDRTWVRFGERSSTKQGDRIPCPQPETPAPSVSQWADGGFECGDTFVVQTQTTITYGWELEGFDWVKTEATTMKTRNRELTDREVEKCIVQVKAQVKVAPGTCDSAGSVVGVVTDSVKWNENDGLIWPHFGGVATV